MNNKENKDIKLEDTNLEEENILPVRDWIKIKY